MKTITKLWILIAVLIILAPIGLLVPGYFSSGAAWGEWGIEELKELVGYIPEGLERLSSIWNAPVPDYVFKAWEKKPLPVLSIAYIMSAVIGIIATLGIVFIIGKFLTRKD